MKKLVSYMTIALMILSVSMTAEAKKKKKKKKAVETEMAAEESSDSDSGASSGGGSYEVPYGMAGCGLWTMVIKGKDQGSQIGVWLLRNAVLNSQTSAITTGSSNCVDKRSKYGALEKEVFVAINLNQLESQAAKGEGAHLNALAEVFGCEDKAAFFDMSQTEFEGIYSSRNPQNVISNYEQIIKAKNLSCVRAG